MRKPEGKKQKTRNKRNKVFVTRYPLRRKVSIFGKHKEQWEKITRNARAGVAETMRNNGGRAERSEQRVERSDKEEGEKGI
jgi:hypothetical protein